MKVLLTFKVSDASDRPLTRHFDMDQKEFHLLKTDYLAYLNGDEGALKAASYKYMDTDTRQVWEIILRFGDILYIESIAQEDSPQSPAAQSEHGDITGPLLADQQPTGPLLSRISGGSTSES
jgi:hypothetical protein